MKASTRNTVRDILSEFVTSQLPKLNRWKLADVREGYPFHRLIFPDDAILAARVERSVVTSMGSRLYPSLAKAIAIDRFDEVFVEHGIEGALNDAAINMIEQIVTELRTPPRRRAAPRSPNHVAELDDILSSRGGGQSTRAVTADLYVGDFKEGPLFIELKTPLPNLDIAAESKRKILYYLAIMNRRGSTDAKAFLGLTYNPFITRQKYGHSYTKQIMDMDNQVLIGHELWDYLGGPGTYTELLDIIDQVRGELLDL